MISVPQRTIRRPVTCSGIGIHSGDPATVVCQPAPLGTGIVFVRVDRPASPAVQAAASMVSDTQRGITLGQRTPVRTVEHLLAAAAGVGVSNLRVEVRGEELPILDGSAAPYVEALTSAGIIEQAGRRPVRMVHSPLWVSQDAAWILAVPADRLRVTYIVSLRAGGLGTQVVDFDALGLHSLQSLTQTADVVGEELGLASAVVAVFRIPSETAIHSGVLDRTSHLHEVTAFAAMFEARRVPCSGGGRLAGGTQNGLHRR